MGWAKPSQPGPVTGLSQWFGWAKQHACTKFTRVATLFKWIKIHLNNVMLIKAKREGMKMKVEHFSSYSSVLLLLLSVSAWCWSWMTKLATLSLFSPAPHSSSSSSYALPCLHCSREQWRHGSAEEEEVARLWLLCCNIVCKKSSLELLLLPLRCKHSKQ